MEIPKEVRVVECNSLELCPKDIIVIKEWKDFMWLQSGTGTLFKLKNSYYILTGDVAYIFNTK